MKRVLNLALALLFVMALTGIGRADDLTYWTDPETGIVYEDPATLHIGSGVTVTSCPGSVFGCGGDPNLLISDTHFSVYQTSNSDAGTVLANDANPFKLIVAVPNATSAQWFLPSQNPIDDLELYNPYDTTTPVGPGTVKAISFTAGFNASTKKDIYGFLNLPGPTNNSNNWVNMLGGEAKWGVMDPSTISSYGVYVFSVSFGSSGTIDVLGPNGAIDINFSDKVAIGSYVFAYGTGPGTKQGTVKAYTTPFTEAGLVPEPASLVLFGSGLAGLAGLARRRKATK